MVWESERRPDALLAKTMIQYTEIELYMCMYKYKNRHNKIYAR